MQVKRSLQFLVFLFNALIMIGHVGFAMAQSDVVSDTENCLLCHRYPSMGRYDKSGEKRVFYIQRSSMPFLPWGFLSIFSIY